MRAAEQLKVSPYNSVNVQSHAHFMAAEEFAEDPLPRRPLHEKDDQDLAVPLEAKKSKIHDASATADAYELSTEEENECGEEVDFVQLEEFEFLDGITRLATLESEFDDIKKGLMLRHRLEKYVPFRMYRPWAHRVFSVTDVTSGMWCEVQVEYRNLHPRLKASREWRRLAEKGSPVVLKTESMKKGSSVHIKKELEVHDIFKVEAGTKEDRAAIQLINTYTQLQIIKSGSIEREVSVFCDPFGLGVLVRGVVDQLQYSLESGELILSDTKTRHSKTMPSVEQKKGASLQLMLYKYMLDSMCLGMTKSKLLYKHLLLDKDALLTKGPIDYLHSCGLSSLFDGVANSSGTMNTPGLKFGTLVDRVLECIAGLGLPLVGQLIVQYEYQDSGEVLGVNTVQYDEQWMRSEVERSIEFWDGTRNSRGVDMEDLAWKCKNCQFRDICVWKLKKELENSPAAKTLPQ